MPQTSHVETHFTTSEKIRDIVIRMSDGLTVPFALAASRQATKRDDMRQGTSDWAEPPPIRGLRKSP
jgi:hypothetical protein